MRHTRKQPFCWQEKKVLRLLKAHCNKSSELMKLRNLYLTLTEIESDFNGKDIKYYTKTIAKYSGLSPDYIPTGLKIFQLLGVIQVVEDRINGRFKGKRVVFTPDNIPENTVPDKPMNGKSVNGNQGTSEDSSFKEDSNIEEDKEHCAKKDSHDYSVAFFPNNPIKNLPASSTLKPSNAERRQRENGAGNYSPEFEKLWKQECAALGGSKYAGSKENAYAAWKKIMSLKRFALPEWFNNILPISRADLLFETRGLQLPKYILARDENSRQIKSLQFWLSNTPNGRGWTIPPESIYRESSKKECYVP